MAIAGRSEWLGGVLEASVLACWRGCGVRLPCYGVLPRPCGADSLSGLCVGLFVSTVVCSVRPIAQNRYRAQPLGFDCFYRVPAALRVAQMIALHSTAFSNDHTRKHWQSAKFYSAVAMVQNCKRTVADDLITRPSCFGYFIECSGRHFCTSALPQEC